MHIKLKNFKFLVDYCETCILENASFVIFLTWNSKIYNKNWRIIFEILLIKLYRKFRIRWLTRSALFWTQIQSMKLSTVRIKLFDYFCLETHWQYRKAIKSVLRPENLDDTIEEESDSEKEEDVQLKEKDRPSSMYGRMYYGENWDLGQSAIVHEKIRRYKRRLQIREKQLNKAFTIIRKQLFRKFYPPPPGEGGSIFEKNKKKFWKSTPLSPLILRKFYHNFFYPIKCWFLLIANFRFNFFELLITRTIYVYIVNILSFLNIRWLTVKVNLVLALKAVKKIARLRNHIPSI